MNKVDLLLYIYPFLRLFTKDLPLSLGPPFLGFFSYFQLGLNDGNFWTTRSSEKLYASLDYARRSTCISCSNLCLTFIGWSLLLNLFRDRCQVLFSDWSISKNMNINILGRSRSIRIECWALMLSNCNFHYAFAIEDECACQFVHAGIWHKTVLVS